MLIMLFQLLEGCRELTSFKEVNWLSFQLKNWLIALEVTEMEVAKVVTCITLTDGSKAMVIDLFI